MQVAVHVGAAAILEEFAGFRQQPFGQHLQALVGLAPTGGAATVEDGNAHQFAHRGEADDAHLAGLAAREEDVVFVEFAGRHFGLLHRRSRRRRLRCPGLGLRVGGRDEATAVLRHHRSAGKSHARSGRRGPQQRSSADALAVFAVAHDSLLGFRFQVADGVMASTGDAPMGLPPAVMTVFGPLPPGRIEGDDSAWRFSRFSRTWIMCGQRWSSK